MLLRRYSIGEETIIDYHSVFRTEERMSPFLVIILVLLVGYKIYKSISTLPNTPPCKFHKCVVFKLYAFSFITI